ncbi:hypothetical protein VNO78_15789 [Psophocarpus tetragonolobus]|uniref:Uncharacterized protein n=1 Tax=Psophocarpus tetragonolobus TaxID=3891 RepID=A0AAN9SFK8_PSOTE
MESKKSSNFVGLVTTVWSSAQWVWPQFGQRLKAFTDEKNEDMDVVIVNGSVIDCLVYFMEGMETNPRIWHMQMHGWREKKSYYLLASIAICLTSYLK